MARQALLSPDALIQGREPSAVTAKVRRLVDDIVADGRPTLVFSNFVTCGARLIQRALEAKGRNFALYVGALSPRERRDVLDRFRSGQVHGMVMSAVGSEGLDIPEAQVVVLADPHFNPEVTRQTIGRALRIGSPMQSVAVRTYVAVGPRGRLTLDGFIERIAARKAAFNANVARLLVADTCPSGDRA